MGESKDVEDSAYWAVSSIQNKTANFFNDKSSSVEMCGVDLGRTSELVQQISAGLGDAATRRTDASSGSLTGFGRKVDEEKVQLELHQLIPERTLNIILEADNDDLTFHVHSLTTEKEELRMLRRNFESRWSPPEISTVLTASLRGKPYSLEQFKSLSHKRELLKAAENLGDGDLILNVVLFLDQTLKKKLFFDILSVSPTALKHYALYLTITKQLYVLTDILDMLGQHKNAAMRLYADACTNPQRMKSKLKKCLDSHITESKDKVVADSFVRLLEWQENYENGVHLGSSAATCLSGLCLNHWTAPKTSSQCPSTFAKSQAISDRLFQWAALTARSIRQAWPDIDTIFLTKGWLGGNKANTELPMEEVVSCLSKYGAPTATINTYLEFIGNLDRRLALAKKLHCHRFAIDTFVAQKDRLGLLTYKASLAPEPESEYSLYAEQCIRNPNIRWKN